MKSIRAEVLEIWANLRMGQEDEMGRVPDLENGSVDRSESLQSVV